MMRWRDGNEEERNGFWKIEKDKRCRICGLEEGRIEHILTYTRNKGVSAVLNEGRGKH